MITASVNSAFGQAIIFQQLHVSGAMAAEHFVEGHNLCVALYASPCDCFLGEALEPLANDCRDALIALTFKDVSVDCRAVKFSPKSNHMFFDGYQYSGVQHYCSSRCEHRCCYVEEPGFMPVPAKRDYLKTCAEYQLYTSTQTYLSRPTTDRPMFSAICDRQLHYIEQGNVHHQRFLWEIHAEKAYISDIIYV